MRFAGSQVNVQEWTNVRGFLIGIHVEKSAGAASKTGKLHASAGIRNA